MSESLSGIVTFLFTDVEGSSRLWESDPGAMSAALARHDAILQEAIATAGGQVFKTAGDAFCAVFTVPTLAIAAAAAGQRALASVGMEGSLPLRVRMAIHAGHAESRGHDYFGPPLNRVARLLAIAHGGQVLISRAAVDLARDELPDGLGLSALGEFALRDLQLPERVFQLTGAGLAAGFPPLRTPEQLLRNVPRPATPLIGREREIAFARSLLLPGQDGQGHEQRATSAATSLLTLTGPGGAGKTRLALHLATELGVAFADGAVFVPLAEISQPALVPAAIAAALDLGEGSGESARDQIFDRLRGREVLLILDNFEQVMGAVTLVAGLLEGCPRLRVIATSRERLYLRGEQELPLPPLSIPKLPPRGAIDFDEDSRLDLIARSEAVRLFVQRAQAVKPEFALTGENALAVVELTQRLDGLPLAIELAAARARALSPQGLLARLERRLDLLSRGPRDLPVRQQTMRDTIAWSFDLLDAAEQRLFATVAVFPGGADLSAVEAIVPDAEIDGQPVFDLLESLADKSLLRLRDGADEPRLEMLQTIREFAQEQLAAWPESRAVYARHAAYYQGLAAEHEPLLAATGQSHSLDRLEQEQANIRAALVWLRDSGEHEAALALGAALWRFWWLRGDMGEGRQQLEALIATPGAGPPEVLAKALNGAGILADSQGDLETAAGYHERSLAIFRELEDARGIAWSLNNLGVVTINQGELPRARTLLEEALQVAEGAGDATGIATALMDLGQIANHEGDRQRAAALWTRSLASFRALGDESHLARSLNNLGYVAAYDGDYERARALFAESLTAHRHVGDRQGMASTLNNLAGVALAMGEFERAAGYCRESHILALESGNQLYAAIAIETLAVVYRRMGDAAGAERSFREALHLFHRVGDLQGIASCLTHLAEFASAAGRLAQAATLLGAVSRYREHHPDLALPNPATEASSLRETLGEEAFTAAWQCGRELSVEELVALTAGEKYRPLR